MTRDTEVLSALEVMTDLGRTLSGSYKEVWEALGFPAEFCHFRALQLARVGRRWEERYQTQFTVLCPDLRDFASDWTGR